MTGDELLQRPVRVRGIHLGRPVDVLLHPEEPQALGLDVLCGDERHRFLPLPAAEVADDHVEAASPLVLLDLREGGFYRRQARSLNELRGTPVGRGWSLQDVVLDRAGTITGVVLDGDKQVPVERVELPVRQDGRRSRWLRRKRR
jgi:hypothetical protein